MAENNVVPAHVGIIMDGNGRWAKQRLMPRGYGHKAGMQNMIALARHCQKIGVKYLTVYVLSTENFNRPQEELEGLYNLIRQYFEHEVSELFACGAGMRVIGDLSLMPPDCQKLLRDNEARSPKDAPFTILFAIGYGGRAEIVSAVNRAVALGQPVTEDSFASLLYTDGIPYPDLIIRTGKEVRLSNFLIWQAAYAELYFCDTLFPDFNEKELDKAVAEYQKRDRRFGKVKS